MMNVIEMMVDNQADLVVHMEADDVTKELQEMDWEQDEGLERAPMMMMVILIVDGDDDGRHWDDGGHGGHGHGGMDIVDMDIVDMDIVDMDIVDMDILSLHNFLSGRPFL